MIAWVIVAAIAAWAAFATYQWIAWRSWLILVIEADSSVSGDTELKPVPVRGRERCH